MIDTTSPIASIQAFYDKSKGCVTMAAVIKAAGKDDIRWLTKEKLCRDDCGDMIMRMMLYNIVVRAHDNEHSAYSCVAQQRKHDESRKEKQKRKDVEDEAGTLKDLIKDLEWMTERPDLIRRSILWASDKPEFVRLSVMMYLSNNVEMWSINKSADFLYSEPSSKFIRDTLSIFINQGKYQSHTTRLISLYICHAKVHESRSEQRDPSQFEDVLDLIKTNIFKDVDKKLKSHSAYKNKIEHLWISLADFCMKALKGTHDAYLVLSMPARALLSGKRNIYVSDKDIEQLDKYLIEYSSILLTPNDSPTTFLTKLPPISLLPGKSNVCAVALYAQGRHEKKLLIQAGVANYMAKAIDHLDDIVRRDGAIEYRYTTRVSIRDFCSVYSDQMEHGQIESLKQAAIKLEKALCRDKRISDTYFKAKQGISYMWSIVDLSKPLDQYLVAGDIFESAVIYKHVTCHVSEAIKMRSMISVDYEDYDHIYYHEDQDEDHSVEFRCCGKQSDWSYMRDWIKSSKEDSEATSCERIKGNKWQVEHSASVSGHQEDHYIVKGKNGAKLSLICLDSNKCYSIERGILQIRFPIPRNNREQEGFFGSFRVNVSNDKRYVFYIQDLRTYFRIEVFNTKSNKRIGKYIVNLNVIGQISQIIKGRGDFYAIEGGDSRGYCLRVFSFGSSRQVHVNDANNVYSYCIYDELIAISYRYHIDVCKLERGKMVLVQKVRLEVPNKTIELKFVDRNMLAVIDEWYSDNPKTISCPLVIIKLNPPSIFILDTYQLTNPALKWKRKELEVTLIKDFHIAARSIRRSDDKDKEKDHPRRQYSLHPIRGNLFLKLYTVHHLIESSMIHVDLSALTDDYHHTN